MMSRHHVYPRTVIAGGALFIVVLLITTLNSLRTDRGIQAGSSGPPASRTAAWKLANSPGSKAGPASVFPGAARTGGAAGNNPDRAPSGTVVSRQKNNEKGPRIAFQGNRSVRTAILEEAMRSLNINDPTESLGALIRRKIREIYVMHGFLRADVVVEPPESTSLDGISVRIDEGRIYTWGEVTVATNTLPSKTVADLFPVQKGWPANLAEIRSMTNAYVNYFKEQGYLDCSFIPEMSLDDSLGRLNIRLKMNEGSRYIVQDVSLGTREAQALFSKIKGQFFSPGIYKSLLARSGLTPDDIRLEFDRSRGRVSILGSGRMP
jgi:hypothetical protein